MKQNGSEAEVNSVFEKNIKTCLQNKKLYLLTDSKIYRENDGN